MKKHHYLFLLFTFLAFNSLNAQDKTTVEAKSSDISDNLDLEAVASLFGDCKNLEDFEKRLNDSTTHISNLDLNEDGEVDYLRVVENAKDQAHLITIQAIIGKDLYQDVATIDVEKDNSGETSVQVVGDVYMYGPNYIIEPVYVVHPVIFLYFWGPHYHHWYSPYYWSYYPSYYHPWHPYPYAIYRSHIVLHINTRHVYHRRSVRKSPTCAGMHQAARRNDYEKKYPANTFEKRNAGIKNRQELEQKRTVKNIEQPKNNNPEVKSTGKKVQKDWKPQTQREDKPNRANSNKATVPARSNSNAPSSRTPEPKSNKTYKSQPNRSAQPASRNPPPVKNNNQYVKPKSPATTSPPQNRTKPATPSKAPRPPAKTNSKPR